MSEPFSIVDVAALANGLGAPTPILVEVLPPHHFAERHLPNARNLPLVDFDRNVSSLLPDRDAAIVVYCAGPTCANSSMAARRLAQLGYSDIRIFEGGKLAWEQAGLDFEVSR